MSVVNTKIYQNRIDVPSNPSVEAHLELRQAFFSEFRIANPHLMMELAHRGEFFSLYRTWLGAEDFLAERDKPESVFMKEMRPSLRSQTAFDVQGDKVYLEIKRWREQLSIPSDKIFFMESYGFDDLTITGDVGFGAGRIDLIYSHEKTNRRVALRERPNFATGLNALNLMKGHMDSTSWETFNEIRKKFPDAIIEFTCFRGPIPKLSCNTVFPEVRHY